MKKINIIAVGDICPGDKAIMGMGVMSMARRYDCDHFFYNTRDILKKGDLVFGNLEGLLTRKVEGDDSRMLTFSGSPEFANSLVDAGFNVLNIANNHTLEHGPEVFRETIRHLEKAGIQICGLRDKSSAFWSKPVIVEKKGVTIGILGYNWVGVDKFMGADNWIAQSRNSLVNYTWQRKPKSGQSLRLLASKMNRHVIKDIQRLRPEVDVLILSAHWGFEFVHYPPYGVTVEAQSFIDAGVDLILGHHPHVIQGMGQHRGKHIFYSLGNFVFDMHLKNTRRSVIIDYTWSPSSISTYKYIPALISRTYQPEIVKGTEAAEIHRILNDSTTMVDRAMENEDLLDDDMIYREYEHQYRIGKLRLVAEHFAAIPKNPMVLSLIAEKAKNALSLLANRIKGRKVRW